MFARRIRKALSVTLGTIASVSAGSVRGRVVQATTSRDSRILVVSGDGGRFEAWIGPDRSFDFPKLRTGNHWVRVIPSLSDAPGTPFEVWEGKTTEIEVGP